MPTYTYKARDVSGKLVKGAMDAASKEEFTDKMFKMGYAVSEVTLAASSIDL